ncbi:helix-turn-helix domain-containing protein [Gimesia algae]
MTQQKLSELLGVSLSYISKVENKRLNGGDYPSEKVRPQTG